MGEPATPASDLYSLGMLAYECLAATPPFRGTPLEVALAHRDRPLPPLPPSASVGVAALVMRLAAKDPAHRPNDAAETAVWAACSAMAWAYPPSRCGRNNRPSPACSSAERSSTTPASR